MPVAINLVQQRFGKLTVISKEPSESGKTYWKCQCDCGNEHTVQTSHLRNGSITSCGKCLLPITESLFCLNCGKPLSKTAKKYCSIECQVEVQQDEYIVRWKAGLETGLTKDGTLSNRVRNYIRKKYSCECVKCGWNKINPFTGKVPVEVHHIDGNHNHNQEENLTLLCPSCHSLTSTYKALNKGQGQKLRYNKPS